MKEIFTFRECVVALNVDFKTFKKWLEKDGIEPLDSAYDERIKLLTAEQVRGLAARHGRPWPPIQQEPEQITAAEAKQLSELVSTAMRQAEQARNAQAVLQAELLVFQQNTLAQLEAIGQTQAEQAERNAQEHAEEVDRWQQTRSALDRVATSQEAEQALTMQRFTQVMHTTKQQDELIEEIKQQQEQARAVLDHLATNYQELAARLAPLPAQIDKQEQAYAQLAPQIDELKAQAQQAQRDIQAELQQMKAATQEQLQQALKGVKAEFQAALHVLRQEIRAKQERDTRELFATIHRVEQDEARDVANLTAEQERQSEQVKMTATSVHALAQRLTALEKQLKDQNAQVQDTEQNPPPAL